MNKYIDKLNNLEAKHRKYDLKSTKYTVVVLDCKSFIKSAYKNLHLKRPNDEFFKDVLVDAVHNLIENKFNILYGYVLDSKIAVILRGKDVTANDLSKFPYTVWDAASARISLVLNKKVTFDFTELYFSNIYGIVNYFYYMQEYLNVKFLDDYCDYIMKNPNDTFYVQPWQTNGIGIYFEPDSVAETWVITDVGLPTKDAYKSFIKTLLT